MFAVCEYIHMHVISERALREFWQKHTDAKGPLRAWLGLTEKAHWQNLTDVRKTFSTADPVKGFTVFNIKGNEYRLVAAIHYNRQKLFIRYVFTHKEYDRWSKAK
jgi:mRNA interferase HigB